MQGPTSEIGRTFPLESNKTLIGAMLNLNFRHFKSLMKAGRIWTQIARLITNWKRRRTWVFRGGGGVFFLVVFQASTLEPKDL